MQIELFGCSSSGKSTLSGRLLRASREIGLDAASGEDFVLRQLRLDGLQGRLLRTLLVDLLTLAACLLPRPGGRGFLRFAVGCVLALPESVSWAQRLNTARNVFKKVGMQEIVRRRATASQVVVMDEGTLQTAHYLFVQLAAEPQRARLHEFLRRVPLPELAIYLHEEEARLVRDTLARGHARIADRSRGVVTLFVQRGLRTFARLVAEPRVRERLWVVAPAGLAQAPADSPHTPALKALFERIGAEGRPADAAAPEALQHAGASS